MSYHFQHLRWSCLYVNTIPVALVINYLLPYRDLNYIEKTIVVLVREGDCTSMKVLSHRAYFMPIFVLFLAFSKVKSTSFKGSTAFDDGILLYANFFPFPHHKLNSTPVESRAVDGEQNCIAACTESSQCRSLNFKSVADANGKFSCHLLDTDKFNSSELFNASLDFHHYSFTVKNVFYI